MTQTLRSLTLAATAFFTAVCVDISAVPHVAVLSAADDPAKPAAPPEGAKPKDAPPESPKKAADGAKAKPESPEAKAALSSAREKLLGFHSIRAKIVETVAVGDRRFKAEGSYVQGSALKLRLEFKVTSQSSTGSILEVCDGQVLWSRYTIGDSLRISRRDVQQILDAARAATKAPNAMAVAELGLGGLPSLLASIDESMTFHTLRDDEIDDQRFKVLEGGWNQQFLDSWKAANPKSPDKLADHIPDAVRIYLDAATYAPRRILYLKWDDEKQVNRPMVTVDFVDLVLNAPVSNDEFYFVPPDNVTPEDITPMYLERLRPAGARKPKS